jgi:hypothetical protein
VGKGAIIFNLHQAKEQQPGGMQKQPGGGIEQRRAGLGGMRKQPGGGD